jgi:hypothetical protein
MTANTAFSATAPAIIRRRRRLASGSAALTAMLALAAATAWGEQAPAPSVAPHAWLYGAWSGGLFPAPTVLSAQVCLAQPVVIFTRDVVLRASILSETYAQRLIETVRGEGSQLEFRFTAEQRPASTGLLGIGEPPIEPGFGCQNPDVLNVQRRTENEIVFPGCSDFPYPLVRCPGR